MQPASRSMVQLLGYLSLLVIALLTGGCSNRQAEPAIPLAQTKPAIPSAQPELATPSAPTDLSAALAAEVADDRPEVLAALGRPDAFDISFVAVEGGQVRMESWRYYQYGTRVDFVDGEAVWTMEIEPAPAGTLFAAWYDPLAFGTGMSGVEAAQVISAASPAGAAVQRIDLAAGGEDLTGGSALIGDQIVIGLHEDRVVYVETVALVPGGGEQ